MKTPFLPPAPPQHAETCFRLIALSVACLMATYVKLYASIAMLPAATGQMRVLARRVGG
jgi:hypothetical protein